MMTPCRAREALFMLRVLLDLVISVSISVSAFSESLQMARNTLQRYVDEAGVITRFIEECAAETAAKEAAADTAAAQQEQGQAQQFEEVHF